MKRIVVIIGIILCIISGCSGKTEPPEPEVEQVEQEKVKFEKEIQQMLVDESSFYFIVDWLTNEEILFVDYEDDNYRLKSFHIYSKEIKNVYETEMMIIDVLIHPSKEYLLVHTSATDTSATVKILTLDGMVQNEVTVESVELEIEWNDLDFSSVLLTAFYEDWSFDAFLFDGETNDIQLLPIQSPFPKWLGTNHFVVATDMLDSESELVIYDVVTGAQQSLDEGKILLYDTFKDALLLVQLTHDEKAKYTILNVALEEIGNWTIEPIKEYSEWILPNFDWLTEKSIVTFQSKKAGTSNYELIKYEDHEIDVLLNDVEDTSLICSPDAKKCLTGHGLEKILDLDNNTTSDWLLFKDN